MKKDDKKLEIELQKLLKVTNKICADLPKSTPTFSKYFPFEKEVSTFDYEDRMMRNRTGV